MQILSNRFDNPNLKPMGHNRSVPHTGELKLSKQAAVSFKGNKEFLELSADEIMQIIEKSVHNPENMLGRGGEASVYKIKGTNYCVRIPHRVNEPGYKRDLSLNLVPTQNDKINHIVAKLGDDITIMPNIKGYNFFSKGVSKARVAEMIDNMPQTTFDRLFAQLYDAQRLGMRFDNSWSNILINPELQSMTAIDFYRTTNPGGLISGMNFALKYNGVTTTEQKNNISRKILTSFVQSVEKGENPKMRSTELDVIGAMIEDFSYSKLMQDIFRQIVDLNTWKHLGGNVALELDGKLKVAKALIRQLF